jgi:molybdopterin molybdotransferase
VEDVEKENGIIRLLEGVNPELGQYIHRRGSDYPKGTTLVKEGAVLRSVEIGIAASCGYTHLKTRRLPTVSIFSTGNELVPVDLTPQDHQIRQSNAHAVRAALASQPVEFKEVGHFSDDVELESQRLAAAVESSDLVVISGAVSKGRLDWIPTALDAIGTKVFHGISQRPGKPMGVWKTSHGCTVFALPGNPVSTLVCIHRYVMPFIRRRLGLGPMTSEAVLDAPYAFDRPLTLYLPVTRLENNRVKPCPVNNSGDYAGLTRTDGFVELAASENHWTAGSKALFFPWK